MAMLATAEDGQGFLSTHSHLLSKRMEHQSFSPRGTRDSSRQDAGGSRDYQVIGILDPTPRVGRERDILEIETSNARLRREIQAELERKNKQREEMQELQDAEESPERPGWPLTPEVLDKMQLKEELETRATIERRKSRGEPSPRDEWSWLPKIRDPQPPTRRNDTTPAEPIAGSSTHISRHKYESRQRSMSPTNSTTMQRYLSPRASIAAAQLERATSTKLKSGEVQARQAHFPPPPISEQAHHYYPIVPGPGKRVIVQAPYQGPPPGEEMALEPGDPPQLTEEALDDLVAEYEDFRSVLQQTFEARVQRFREAAMYETDTQYHDWNRGSGKLMAHINERHAYEEDERVRIGRKMTDQVIALGKRRDELTSRDMMEIGDVMFARMQTVDCRLLAYEQRVGRSRRG